MNRRSFLKGGGVVAATVVSGSVLGGDLSKELLSTVDEPVNEVPGPPDTIREIAAALNKNPYFTDKIKVQQL